MNLKSRVLQESPSELRNPHGGTGLEGPKPDPQVTQSDESHAKSRCEQREW